MLAYLRPRMITANNLTFEFSGRPLYENVNFDLHPRQRIGIVGRNGTGKSTLLRLLNKEYQPSSGSLNFQSGLNISYFNQDLLSFMTDASLYHVVAAVFQEVLDAMAELDEVTHQMEQAFSEDLMNRMFALQEKLELSDAYTLESRVKRILAGLGFTDEDCDSPYGSFSGGWRMRAQLAKCLLANPDVLMLDEPTNHLDLPAIEWLEGYLRSFEGTLIVVSHDRFLLDRLCNRILEIERGKITAYTGNFSSYIEQKEEALMLQAAAYKNQQSKLKQEERFIERFRAKASKAKAVKSRIKLLEKLERIDAPDSDQASMNLKLKVRVNPGKIIQTLEHVNKHYGEKKVVKEASAIIERGDKIALIGPNGQGKSTLLRVMGGITEHGGNIINGHNVKPAYFAQHQAEVLDPAKNMLDEVLYDAGGMTEREVRTILGSFLFTGEDVLKKTGVLSGGEKMRVALAKLITSDANFLLLDEPTNHLDMLSVEVLIDALNDYEGTYVVVSHDRFFLSEVATKIWYLDNGRLMEYPGSYEEFDEWKNQQLKLNAKADKASEKVEKKAAAPAPAAPVAKPVDKSKEKEQAKLQKQLEEAEKKQQQIRDEIFRLEEEAVKPEVYTYKTAIAELKTKLEQTRQKLAEADQEWERIFELLVE